MKKSVLILLAILVLCVSLAFAASGTKSLSVGPNTYSISEDAPDFLKWQYRLLGANVISEPPDLCAIDVLEGMNPDQTVIVTVIRFIENDSVYILAVMVAYIQKEITSDIYEDLGLIQTGKPSFQLTKVKNSSNIEAFLVAKKKQHDKRTSGGKNMLFWEI